MKRQFKIWSESSPTAKGTLAPSLEMRGWNDVSSEDKRKILKHLGGLGWFSGRRDSDLIIESVDRLNSNYRVNTYGKELFEMGGPQSEYSSYSRETQLAAAKDFFRIIRDEEADVAFELLSFYAEGLIEDSYLPKEPSDEDIDKAHDRFDRFCRAIDDVFTQFGVNISLTRQGFVPKQEQIVQELVVEPVFNLLVDPKWKDVQADFSDALNEYRKGTGKSYSTAITHLASALQAYLQIKVRGKIGKGDISKLIKDGVKSGALPDDALSKKIFDGIESELMSLRQKHGDAHPKAEYANEQSVRLVLNIVAVFIQHCESSR